MFWWTHGTVSFFGRVHGKDKLFDILKETQELFFCLTRRIYRGDDDLSVIYSIDGFRSRIETRTNSSYETDRLHKDCLV